MRQKGPNFAQNQQNRLKNKKYYRNYNKYYYLKKILENPDYNKDNYRKKKTKKTPPEK